LYKIVVQIEVADAEVNPDGKNTTNTELAWMLKLFYFPYYPTNAPPYILPKPPILALLLGQEKNLKIPSNTISNDTVSVEISISDKMR
jgi:hypothetical protein